MLRKSCVSCAKEYFARSIRANRRQCGSIRYRECERNIGRDLFSGRNRFHFSRRVRTICARIYQRRVSIVTGDKVGGMALRFQKPLYTIHSLETSENFCQRTVRHVLHSSELVTPSSKLYKMKQKLIVNFKVSSLVNFTLDFFPTRYSCVRS